MADPKQPSSSSRSDSRAGTEGNRTMEQGVEYLKLVKDTFGSREDIRYRAFLRVMKDYKKGEYDTLEIISFAREFFEGHHELLTGFNILLPRGYSIDSAPNMDLPENLRVTVDAVTFVHKVKTRLQNDKPCYNTFLGLLNGYHRNLFSIQIVVRELPIIFQDYPDILAELPIYFRNNE